MLSNFLEQALQARENLNRRYTAGDQHTSGIFLCHLLGATSDWAVYVTAHMENAIPKVNPWVNNIFSYVVGLNKENETEACYQVTEIIRRKWLDDLIDAIYKDGDHAKLPDLIPEATIKQLLKKLQEKEVDEPQ